jgi:catechol 2,3-dioxygenase-like lactoylglutathione lyase family enzyme
MSDPTRGTIMSDAKSDKTSKNLKNESDLVPRMLHHAGYVTQDAAKTVDFYSRILGMEFIATVMDDKVPSTGEDFPYLHLFFEMGDGSTLAFFESPCMGPPSAPSHPAYDVFNHTALNATSRAEVDTWAQRLTDHGVDVLGPIDHGIIYSIYFEDPNGLRLEITTTTDASWKDHGKDARRDLEDWVAAKKRAAEEGIDTTTALLELIAERKSEMRERGIIGADEIHSS